MTARHYVRNADGTFEDITAHIRLYTLDVTMRAEEGSPATSTVTIDDPAAELDIVGLRDYRIFEDAAVGSNTLVYAGHVADRKVTRGPYRQAASRVWETNLVDINAYLGRRLLTNTVQAARPAESDVARVRWLLSTWQVVHIGNEQYVDTSNPVAMDKTDYRGQSASEVLDDCAQQSGKNWFLWYDEANETYGLWYGYDDSSRFSSPVRLSNDLADIGGTTYAIADDDTYLTRDPSRVYSGVRVTYDGGVVFVRRSTVASLIGGARETEMGAYNVKTEARATARANRYLDDLGSEEDVITTAYYVPRAEQGLLQAGMRVQFKATHLPGYENFTWLRCISRNAVEASEELYRIQVDLASGGGPVTADCQILGQTHGTPNFDIPIGNTPSGYYPQLSHYGLTGNDYVIGAPDGLTFYLSSGGGGPRKRPLPNPGTIGDGSWGGWSFRDYAEGNGSVPSGLVDGGAAVGWPEKLQVMVVGAGQLTLHAVSTEPSNYELYKVDIPNPSDPDDDVAVIIETGALSYPDTTIDVPNDGACFHYVVVYDEGPIAGSLYWGGFTWDGDSTSTGSGGSPGGTGGGVVGGGGDSGGAPSPGGTGGTLVAATPGALASAIAAASNGDTLTLRGGTHLIGSGAGSGYGGIVTSKGLTIQNYAGETPVITWDSSTRNNGLYFTGSPATLIGLTFQASAAVTHDSNGSAQVELDGGSGLTIDSCTFIGHANYDDHQQLVYQRYGSNIIVRRSVFTANGTEGFGFHQYPGTAFDPNCLIEDCTFTGFAVSGGVTSDSRISVRDSLFNNNNIAVQLRNDADGSVITGNSGTGNSEPLQNNVSGVTDSGNTWT